MFSSHAFGHTSGVETAVKHSYNPSTRCWTQSSVTVSMAAYPFQEGTMRQVYELTDYSLPAGQQQCVAKLSKDPHEARDTYFAEVEMQYKCKDLASKFNAHGPPKRIDFVNAWVLEFPRRRAPGGGPLVAQVEQLLRGHYAKHSNNFGFVSPEDRNTPQAFSHWTWVHSGGKLLVCDIQGVGDLYTDPQIHSNAGHNNFLYGRGDMGMEGIQQFFHTHRCNSLCRFLGLQPTSGSNFHRHGFETGTAVRNRPPSPLNDIYSYSANYSPASLSPASSVGGISTGSGGFGEIFVPRLAYPMLDYGMTFPQLPLPIVINI